MKQQPSKRRAGNGSDREGIRRPPHGGSAGDDVAVLEEDDALSVLEALAGSVEAPADWSAEHDHYLYGVPKRAAGPA